MLKTLIMDKLYFYRNIIEEKHRIVLEQGSLAKCKPSVDNSFLKLGSFFLLFFNCNRFFGLFCFL